MTVDRPLRVLLVYRALFRGRDEALEVREIIAGVAESAPPGSTVTVTNGREVFTPTGDDLAASGPFRPHRGAYDVVHLHLALPVAHLRLALRLRLLGARVVLTPMAMLGDDFARSSWFRSASRVRLAFKPLAVRLLRYVWLMVAHRFVVASPEEAAQGRLPDRRCYLAPLATPDSPVGAAAARTELPGDTPPPGPIAFTTRFDVHRKGIDRLCSWLDASRDELPRPAVLLLAPSDEPAPPEVTRLVGEGLLEWDAVTRGADLLPYLARCRGQMLLSRYDGQPRVLREAAVLGLPTISTVASHFSEVVAALGTGAVVDGDEPADITAAYQRLPEQPRRGAEARELFARARIGAYLWRIYGAVVGRGDAPRSYYALRGGTE